MNRQYINLFKTKNLNLNNLKQNILQLYPQIDPKEPLNLDQLLFIFDQQCHHKSNRDVASELYQQVRGANGKATLGNMVSKYIQNLQTSKICILRDEGRLKQLGSQMDRSQSRPTTFIFFKLINVSIYTQFTKDTSLQYKIIPTQIPPIALNNSQHLQLNHEYILEMEEPEFDLVFYQSGIEIFKWTFPDQQDLSEGEYYRKVNSQHLSFEARVKYMPKGREIGLDKTQKQIRLLQNKIQSQMNTFRILCAYQPFLQKQNNQALIEENQDRQFNCKSCWVSCFPCLQRYVLVTYWMSIVMIILQTGASLIWPAQFLDLMLLFYLLGLLSSFEVTQYYLKITIIQLSLVLFCLKSIWGFVLSPIFPITAFTTTLIAICIILKLLLALELFLLKINEQQTRQQCDWDILKIQKPEQKQNPEPKKLQYDIWDD